jgi:hypothetical protein
MDVPLQVLRPGVQHQAERRCTLQPRPSTLDWPQTRSAFARCRQTGCRSPSAGGRRTSALRLCGSVNTKCAYGTGNTSASRPCSQASLARAPHCGQCRLRQEWYCQWLWPQVSQASCWPPSAAVRHAAIPRQALAWAVLRAWCVQIRTAKAAQHLCHGGQGPGWPCGCALQAGRPASRSSGSMSLGGETAG